MKKNYIAPQSVNVKLDPLMVSFGMAANSPTQITTPISNPVVNPDEYHPTVVG